MRANLFQQLRKIRAESAKSSLNRTKLDTSDLLPKSSFHRKRKLDDSDLLQTTFRYNEKEKYE